MHARRTLLSVLAVAGSLLPVAPSSAAAPDPRPFVHETLAPTPKSDPVEAWRTNSVAHTGWRACGTYPVAYRFDLPTTMDGRFVVNLRRNVIPWGGGAPPYSMVVRTDGATGPVAHSGPLQSGNAYVDVTASITAAHLAAGFVDLYPTILCPQSPAWEGWRYYPDADWGYWDVEAYHVPGRAGRLAGVERVTTYYRYGFSRLDDLAKYELVILAETYATFAPQLSELRAAGTTVAGYLNFTLEERCSPSDPMAGDGAGPGGFDSRYVDYIDAAGAKVPDGFPDEEPGPNASCRYYRTDPRTQSWRSALLTQAARHAANGVTALFLDGFEPMHPDLVPGMRQTVLDLRAAFPDMPIVANGYQGYPAAGDLVDAVMLESFTYSYGGVRVDPSLDGIRDDLARDANFVRGYPGVVPGSAAPSFEVLSMDTIEPYSASEKISESMARAAANGMVFGAWDLVMANPANDLVATRAGSSVALSWTVASATPAPEEMSSVGRYEIRRASWPIVTDADWLAATPVATTLPAGSRTFTDPSAPASAHYALRAYRTGTGGLELYGTLSASAPPGSTAPSADLSVAQAHSPSPVTTGDVVELRMSVTNQGPAQATGVTVTQTLPAGMTFVSSTTGCTAAGSAVTCAVGTVPAGSSASLMVVAQPTVGGTLSVTAAADAAEPDPDPSDDAVTTAVPVLKCTKVGTAGNDTVNGTMNPDVLCGLGGDDSLVGMAGNDVLVGGAGNDRLRASKGDDVIDGGAGTDTGIWTGDGVLTGVTVDLAAGTATNVELGMDTIVRVDGRSSIENIEGSGYADRLVGDQWPNSLNGLGGNDTILPGAGVDAVIGGTGLDTVSYEWVDGGTGVVVDLVAGTARVGAETDTLSVVRNAIGTPYADTITGDGYVNILTGLGGSDVLTGAAANDKLYGGDGDDTLDGGTGTDTLDGGLGWDVCRLGESKTGCDA